MSKKIIVIVDAYSTGKHLAPLFSTRGYECLHVQTTKKIPKIFAKSFIMENFSENFIIDNNIDEIAEKLKLHSVECIIAGSETGVFAADHLSESLKIKSNGTKKSKARYDKYEMINTLKSCGIKTADYIKSDKLQCIFGWSNTHNAFPVVLKPLQSAGNDNVIFCNNNTEIEHAFTRIINNKNLFDQVNTAVLAESFLAGDEYIVNTVSADGHHYIAEIWQCVKKPVPNGGYLSVLEKLMPADFSRSKILKNYATSVLDALDIKHGPGHLEIMYTPDGPILIEAAARLQGCVDPAALEQALGDSQASLTVDAYLSPEKIINKSPDCYQRKQSVYRAFMLSPKSGMLSKTPNFEYITTLNSYFSMQCSLKKNSRILQSTDIASTIGYIHLVNADPDQLELDYQAYREHEASNLLCF